MGNGRMGIRTLAGAITAALTLLFGLGTVASASAYPPSGPTITLSDPQVAPGATVTMRVSGCVAGEQVTFRWGADGTTTSTCAADATLVAPTTPGTYTITATAPSGLVVTATLTVLGPAVERPASGGEEGGSLPSTGSDGAPVAVIAGVAVLLGLGLVAVAWRRRRPAAA